MARDNKPGRVKAALMNWLGVPIGLKDGTFWSEYEGRSSSGKSVTVNKALQLSAVFACVKLLSETVSTLPLRLYERMPDGTRRAATEHPMYNLLAVAPNAEMTPARFMLLIVASLALRGNAYVEKKRVAGRVVALIPLLPQNMTVKRQENGRLRYTYVENGTDRTLDEKDVMHIRAFGLDGVCGLHPVMMGSNVLGTAVSAEEAAAKVFEQGMQASGILTTDKSLTPQQRNELNASMTRFAGSKNAGKVMVAEYGLKYQGITMNPEAAQMLESRNFAIEEICRWFGIPPFMVGHMDKQSSWASSVEGMNLQWLTNGLRPLLENLEQEVHRCLLERDPRYFVEYSVEGLLRADSAGRASYYTTGLQNGWMSRNEVRRLENLPPIPGGDVYTVQSNLLPIDQLGKAQDGEQARSALAAWLFPAAPKDSKPE